MYSSQCYTTHFASDSASIIQQFTGTIAPKRGGMSEITHPHAAVFTWTTTVIITILQFLVRSFSGGAQKRRATKFGSRIEGTMLDFFFEISAWAFSL